MGETATRVNDVTAAGNGAPRSIDAAVVVASTTDSCGPSSSLEGQLNAALVDGLEGVIAVHAITISAPVAHDPGCAAVDETKPGVPAVSPFDCERSSDSRKVSRRQGIYIARRRQCC